MDECKHGLKFGTCPADACEAIFNAHPDDDSLEMPEHMASGYSEGE